MAGISGGKAMLHLVAPDDVRGEHEVSRDDDVDLVGRFERERSLDRLIPLQDLPDRIAEGLASSARQRRRGAAVV
ncbi:hypothetical protein G6F63_015472 [Rhizopus arrhizus]|nr:hypothetical protein G6F63_015472 [Rhizopus arrhizus]